MDDRENTPSLSRRRCLCQIVEALSRVAGTENMPFCLDQFSEVTTTKMMMIGDEVLPTAAIQQTLEPVRWRMNIVQMCLQEDPVVRHEWILKRRDGNEMKKVTILEFI